MLIKGLYKNVERILGAGRDSSLITRDGGARYEEAVDRGRVYAVANQSGVASQAGLSATTPVLTIANPLNSGIEVVLWYVGSVYLVAFGAAAAIWLAYGAPHSTAVTGTESTVVKNVKTGLTGRGLAIPFLAATLPAAPLGISLLGAGLTGAITTMPALPVLGRWFDGSIKIPPGANVSVQTSTASGASGQLNEFIYEERDL